MKLSKKPRYNLSLVLQETGLKADTIRAWERRYGLPAPDRSAGGQRLYSDYDLQQVKWLVAWMDEGMRIGQAAAYWHEMVAAGNDPLENIQHQVELTAPPLVQMENASEYRESWIEASLAFDEQAAEQILSRAFALFPPETVCTDLLLPGLEEIGSLWQSGEISVQQEHFTTAIASRKLQSLIASAPGPSRQERIMLSNPPGEQHTIILEMLTLLLKNRGWRVTYLGANVPNSKLISTIEANQAKLVVLTAARLETSATLLETLYLLAGAGIQSAYGGSIFNKIPELTNRFPGNYLGESLVGAITKIEELILRKESEPQAPEDTNPYQELIMAIRINSNQISQAFLDSLIDSDLSIERDSLQISVDFLLGDLTAALRLGDLAYLTPNLDWIISLQTERGWEGDLMETYLGQFSKAIQDLIGKDSDPIINYLTAFLQTRDKDDSK